MDIIIISDQKIDIKQNKSILELLTHVHYVVDNDFSRVRKKIESNAYKLIVFLTVYTNFPPSWRLNELKSKAAILTMTKVDKLDLVIFSSFLKSIGLLSESMYSLSKEADLPQFLYESLIFIEENIHENDLSLEKVASNVYISRCHYSRIFKTFFGIGFKEYVIGKRIQKAKQLLEEGRSVTEVCYAVGYGDLTHFGRMFKKVVGINPSAYRKKHYKRIQLIG